MTTENWREEFDNRYIKEPIYGDLRITNGKEYDLSNDIKEFISTLLSKERNKNNEAEFNRGWECALDEVKKEVEKKTRRTEEFGFCTHCPFHKGDMEHYFGKCAGYEEGLTDISTLLENLKNNISQN